MGRNYKLIHWNCNIIVRSVVVNPFNVLYGGEWCCFEAHIENGHVTTSPLLTMSCFGVVLAECEKQEFSVMFVLLRLEEFWIWSSGKIFTILCVNKIRNQPIEKKGWSGMETLLTVAYWPSVMSLSGFLFLLKSFSFTLKTLLLGYSLPENIPISCACFQCCC